MRRRCKMIDYYNEVSALFDVYENEEHLTEREIYQRCLTLIKNHDFDIDYMWAINDAVNNRGYCFQFEVPSKKSKKFNYDEYNELITNTSKSKNKTQELIKFLNGIRDDRLTFISLHALKTKYLIELGILPSNNEWINTRSGENFRDLMFESLSTEEEQYSIVMDAAEKIGIEYIRLSYMQFWLDMEWLLWTIEKADPRKGHIKVNTIKVAFGITPKLYLERGDKKYYDPSFSKKLNGYLKLIDKDLLKKVKDHYKDSPEQERPWGYSLLFKVL